MSRTDVVVVYATSAMLLYSAVLAKKLLLDRIRRNGTWRQRDNAEGSLINTAAYRTPGGEYRLFYGIESYHISHTACKDEFRRNLRSHSWSVFSFFIISWYVTAAVYRRLSSS